MLDALAYAAGYLEGEGSFLPNNGGKDPVPLVKAHSTDFEPLERMRSEFGGYLNGPYEQRGNRKPQWIWKLRGDAAITLMVSLRPLMSTRRQQQIDAVLDA